MLVRLYQENSKPGRIAILISEQAAGMEVYQSFNALGAGTSDADSENLFHLNDSREE